MPSWLERLRKEATTVASAPLLLASVVLLAIVVIWGALHWSYRAVLAGKDSHIAMLERRVAEYRESLRGAAPDEAERRIEALETEVKTLRLRLHPRRLTAVQRQAILDRSRLPAGARPYGLTVLYERDCSDCQPFAGDLASTLDASGSWTVSMEPAAPPFERPHWGVAVSVPDPLRPPPEGVILQEALRSAGLPFTVIVGTGDPKTKLLVVERMPE
jgi:hypothetical protein